MTESDQIDEILQDAIEGSYPVVTGGSSELYRLAIRKAKAYKLIEQRDKTWYISKLGLEANELGGFDKWMAANKKREDELHQAALDSSKATVDSAQSAKLSKYAAYVSALAAIAAIFIPQLFTTTDSSNREADSTINALRVKVDTIYSQLQSQSQSQKSKAEPLQTRKTK